MVYPFGRFLDFDEPCPHAFLFICAHVLVTGSCSRLSTVIAPWYSSRIRCIVHMEDRPQPRFLGDAGIMRGRWRVAGRFRVSNRMGMAPWRSGYFLSRRTLAHCFELDLLP